MAPAFKREAKRKRTSRLSTLLRVIFVYIAYLAFWKCPISQPLPASSGCCSVPCTLLHQAVDSQLRPVWEQYGQPHYAKHYPTIEPYVAPVFSVVKSRAEPVILSAQAKAQELYAAHAKTHVDKAHALAEPYTAQIAGAWHYLEPHRSTVRTHLGPWADAAATKGRAWLVSGWQWTVLKLRELDVYLKPHFERGVNSSSAFIAAQAQTAAARLQQHWHAGLEAAASWISKRLPGNSEAPIPGAEVTLDEPLSEELPVPTLDSSQAQATIQTVPVADSTKQAKIQTVPVEDKVKIQTVPVGKSSSSSSLSTTTVPSSSASASFAGTIPKNVPVEKASDFISKAAAPVAPKAPKLGWPQRVERTAKGALRNLDQDCHDAQERIIADSKPDIVSKLRDLSAFGEEAARELTELTVRVENNEAEEYGNEMDLFSVYDKKAQKIQNMMLEVRSTCEDMAGAAIAKMSALRQEAADSLEDFFEAVLSEASKEAAAKSGQDDDEWSSWQAIGKLKKQLAETRKTIEAHEPDMELVNNALRESQQAAILLAQDVSQHLRALRGRAQFHIQQESLLKAKANADKPVDAVFEDLTENEEEQRQHVLGEPKDAQDAEELEEQLEEELKEEELEEEIEEELEAADADETPLDTEDPEDAEETETTYVTSVVYRTRFNTQSHSI